MIARLEREPAEKGTERHRSRYLGTLNRCSRLCVRSVVNDTLVWMADPELCVGSVRSDALNRIWVLFKESDIGIVSRSRTSTSAACRTPETGQARKLEADKRAARDFRARKQDCVSIMTVKQTILQLNFAGMHQTGNY